MMTFDELCEEYANTDSFMVPDLTCAEEWWVVDSMEGICWIPVDDIGTISQGMLPDEWWTISMATGYGARLSAPGYMDCTDWCVFNTEQEAIDYLAETYLD